MTLDDATAADRCVIEEVVNLLLAGAPPDWTHLHGEFALSGQLPRSVTAVLTVPAGSTLVPVSAVVLGLLAEHQRRAVAAGAPWEQLIVDCYPDGRLSVRSGPDVSAGRRLPWLRQALAALSVGCLAAAAVVFALGHQWSPPPRADIISVPPLPARQQQVWEIINRWLDAENRSDTTQLRRMMCADRSPRVAGLVTTFEHRGNDQRLIKPDAIVSFGDDGSRVTVTVSDRVHPISDSAKQTASDPPGGLYQTDFVLKDEAGELKVCDESDINLP